MPPSNSMFPVNLPRKAKELANDWNSNGVRKLKQWWYEWEFASPTRNSSLLPALEFHESGWMRVAM